MTITNAIKADPLARVQAGARALSWRHPHFGLAWAKIKHLVRVDAGATSTMAIDKWGRVYVNPAFLDTVPQDRVAGLLAHEIMHLILEHAGRLGSRDAKLWNVAGDMVINSSLKGDSLALPEGALFPPPNYSGPLTTDAIYDFLRQNPDQDPTGGAGEKGDAGEESTGQGAPGAPGDGDKSGQPKIGQGCGVKTDTPKPGDSPGDAGAGSGPVDVPTGSDGAPDWGQVRREVQAMAKAAGTGSARCVQALEIPPARTDWRKLIRSGAQMATIKSGRDWQTLARRNRRSPVDGVQLAGWTSTDPTLAIVVDVSGSMSRSWVAQIHAEALKVASLFPGVRMYLIAHTDRVVWEGWIKSGQSARIGEALAHSGGTNPGPAYDALRKAGRFDTVIHFTDCEFFGEWPTPPPGARLIVGQFGPGDTVPPAGARIVPCVAPN